MRFLGSRNSYKWLYIVFSGILSKDIAWQFEHLHFDSFLKMGMNLLDFRIEGNTPSKKEKLNNSDNWFEVLLLSNYIYTRFLLEYY